MWLAKLAVFYQRYVYESKLNLHSSEEGPVDSRIFFAAMQRVFEYTRALGYTNAMLHLTMTSEHGNRCDNG